MSTLCGWRGKSPKRSWDWPWTNWGMMWMVLRYLSQNQLRDYEGLDDPTAIESPTKESRKIRLISAGCSAIRREKCIVKSTYVDRDSNVTIVQRMKPERTCVSPSSADQCTHFSHNSPVALSLSSTHFRASTSRIFS